MIEIINYIKFVQKEILSISEKYSKVAIVDIDGVLRGKYLSHYKIEQTKGEFGFCDVVYHWDILDEVYGFAKENGSIFADASVKIDPASARQLPDENNLTYLLADFDSPGNQLNELCSRSLLKKICKKLDTLNIEVQISHELEWFMFPQSIENESHTLLNKGYGYSLFRLYENKSFFEDLLYQSIPFRCSIEGLHSETGPGACEASFLPAQPVEAADTSTFFKLLVKQLAHKHGYHTTFMAKPNLEKPGAGGHIHFSLWNKKTGENLLLDPVFERHFIGGIIESLPALTLVFCPNINSYKRLVKDSWAPTKIAWGYENRTALIRKIERDNKPQSRHLEFRLPGADVNPYIAMSAILGAGLYGLEHKINPTVNSCEKDIYEMNGFKNLPYEINEAIEKYNESTLPIKILGEKFSRHFLKSRLWEYEKTKDLNHFQILDRYKNIL